ncbi:MAG TPA: HAMP domain-containing sensor histidine kinase [Candidatus Binatia bacterium]|jgi:signal transduction histidine kinase
MRLWPKTLFGRIALILFAGLAVTQALTMLLVLAERGMSTRRMMIAYVARDIAGSVAILERVPAEERPHWLERIARRNYRYALGPGPVSPDAPPSSAAELVQAVSDALGSRPVKASAADGERLDLQFALADGAPVSVELESPGMALSPWVVVLLALQLLLLALFTWLAVRSVTRPLADLAAAADQMGSDPAGGALPEDGPVEVARAAAAFNAMQGRIAAHLRERMQILASVSHDLQTPITRMRLRVEMSTDAELRPKLGSDLDQMQALVREGIAYARSAEAAREPFCRVDLHALLESLVFDYADAGRSLLLRDERDDAGAAIVTRPRALTRIVSNLADNALIFADDVDILVQTLSPETLAITVRDRGPGIPADKLAAVVEPFVRLENSRSRETGGTGLGLAIADQLAASLGGQLRLSNRDGGGLEARVVLPRAATIMTPNTLPTSDSSHSSCW